MSQTDTDPPGFALYRLYQTGYSHHEMFVPSNLKDKLEAESKRRFMEREAEQDKVTAIAKAQAREEAISSSKASASTEPGTDNNGAKSKEQIALEKATQAWAGMDASDKTRSSRHRYPVFKS